MEQHMIELNEDEQSSLTNWIEKKSKEMDKIALLSEEEQVDYWQQQILTEAETRYELDDI
jgi:hypothetical protein